jgi:inorganic pyrophosphatase
MATAILTAWPIGGMRMVDHNQADDKIIAVLDGDLAYGGLNDMHDCPKPLLDRLKHYFLSYKRLPDEPEHLMSIDEVYDRWAAIGVMQASINDYVEKFGAPGDRLAQLQELLASSSKRK